jgi:hypothetical protein
MAGLTSQFTDDQIDEFKEAFNLFDKNQDGTIYESQVAKCRRTKHETPLFCCLNYPNLIPILTQVVLVLNALGIRAKESDLKVIFCSLLFFEWQQFSQ